MGSFNIKSNVCLSIEKILHESTQHLIEAYRNEFLFDSRAFSPK